MKRDRSGVYHNDYSPRYKPAYDIYEKAREHMRDHKKKKDQSSTIDKGQHQI